MKMKVREMTAADRNYVLPRVKQFYQSDAVDHGVPEEILQETFENAVSKNPYIEGYILENTMGKAVGYAYITRLFASEAGSCVMIEEVYIDTDERGKGYGKGFFEWLFAANPEVKRFRLEVTAENTRAQKLYESMGFARLDYRQMIRGR